MKENMKFIMKYVKPYYKKFVLCQIYMLLTTLSGLAFPYVLGTLLDSAFQDKNLSILILSLSFLFVVMFAKEIFNFLKAKKLSEINNNLVKDIRQDTYEALQKKSLGYYDHVKSGDIVSGLTGDIVQVQSTITSGFINLFQSIISLVTVTIALFGMDPLLASITLTIIPLIALSSSKLGKKVKPVSQSIRQRLGYITTIINESISGIDIIKLFKLEKHALDIFETENEKLVKDSVKETKMKATNSLMIGLLYLLQFITIITLGSRKVFRGTMTPGALISFVLYADMIAGPLSAISGIYMEIKSASASLDRIKSMTKSDDPYEESSAAVQRQVLKGDIKFENVHFSYENENKILDGVSFHIEPGMTAAFVGKSGAGKSTVLKLIPGFYHAQRGDIKIDDISINDYKLSDLREHIAIVPQESFLFGMSIKDNILCGKTDASDLEIIMAAKKANAHDFIMALPDGYSTIAGERGAKLSGGQRQRIAIARAFVKSPKILLLDEATSALDSETEAEVQQALNNLMKDRTVIVIAHRLSTIIHSEVIFVMDQGKIVQKGTHADLMETSIVYRNLYNEYTAKTIPDCKNA